MKQEERRQQTRELLLRSINELIDAKGCHSITMQDIMEKSGLSKGAIFHYVKSKDELFAWVLQNRLEETNQRFMSAVEQHGQSFHKPMQQIADSLRDLESDKEVTNKVLLYLLGKEDQPTIAEALKTYYERSVSLSKQWIVTGQRHGVIPESVDADRTADMFCLLSIGFRVRSSIPLASVAFTTQDYSSLMIDLLQPRA